MTSPHTSVLTPEEVEKLSKLAELMRQSRSMPSKEVVDIQPPRNKYFQHYTSVLYNNYMRNAHVYLWCKKIHRYLVLAIATLGVLMGGTGYMMHENTYILLPAAQIRTLHNNFSIVFAIVLGVMTLTGLYMFVFPYLKVKQPPQPPLSN